jgi:hypothetical protein
MHVGGHCICKSIKYIVCFVLVLLLYIHIYFFINARIMDHTLVTLYCGCKYESLWFIEKATPTSTSIKFELFSCFPQNGNSMAKAVILSRHLNYAEKKNTRAARDCLRTSDESRKVKFWNNLSRRKKRGILSHGSSSYMPPYDRELLSLARRKRRRTSTSRQVRAISFTAEPSEVSSPKLLSLYSGW